MNIILEQQNTLFHYCYHFIEANLIRVHIKDLWEKKKFKGLELKGKKIGLIGFGNVAERVCRNS